MPTGRKERIVIACVTFEVAKIVDPAIYYEATRVHLIHYSKKPVYKEFYDEVCRRIKESLPKATILEYGDEPVFSFKLMMKRVLSIISEEQKTFKSPEIYVNVSAGPSEYTTASLIASMMMDNITPFNVATEAYQIPEERLKEIYFDGDRPVGMSKTTKTPELISTYSIQKPDEKLVLGLQVLKDNLKSDNRAPAPKIIEKLEEKKLIVNKKQASGKPDQNTTMTYQRNFMNRWIDEGWVEKESRREIKITDEGNTVLEIFHECYNQLR